MQTIDMATTPLRELNSALQAQARRRWRMQAEARATEDVRHALARLAPAP